LTKVLDVIGGLIFGGVVWIILNVLLTFIPIIGWIFAAFIGGYLAGRFGGTIAAVILAVIAPIVIGMLGASLIALLSAIIPVPILWRLASGILGTVIALWALVNLTFVGLGGYVGNKAYRSSRCPKCGEKITKGVPVCPNCGRDLNLKVPTEEKTESRSPENQKVARHEASEPQQGDVSRVAQIDHVMDDLKRKFADGKINEDTYKYLKNKAEEELRNEFEKMIRPVEEPPQQANVLSSTKSDAAGEASGDGMTHVSAPEPGTEKPEPVRVIGIRQKPQIFSAKVVGVRKTEKEKTLNQPEH